MRLPRSNLDWCDLSHATLPRAVDKKNRPQYKSSCTMSHECDRFILSHQCDMTPGMSGGPLITPDDGVLRAVALGTLDDSHNSAVLISQTILDFIDEAIDTLSDPVA